MFMIHKSFLNDGTDNKNRLIMASNFFMKSLFLKYVAILVRSLLEISFCGQEISEMGTDW